MRSALGLALTCLEPRVDLVDHVDAALAAHETVGPVAALQRFQRVLDFHNVRSGNLATKKERALKGRAVAPI